MAVKFLTFLGNSNYDQVLYIWKERRVSSQFVQVALMELLDLPDELEIYVFLTKSAKEKNWGMLEDQLKKYSISIHPVDILDGRNEGEIWSVFNSILEELQDGDLVYFDITNSLRFQPMLALLVLHFAKVVKKNIQVCGIYYGYVDMTRREGEIIDLTSFVDLQEWVTRVNIFLLAGRAAPLHQRVKIKGDQTGEFELIQSFSEQLHQLTVALETHQSHMLSNKADEVVSLLEKVQTLSLPIQLQPLQSLFKKIEQKVFPIASRDPIESGIAAVEWCRQHGLIQQAYTMLHELVTTAVCYVCGIEQIIENYKNKRDDVKKRTLNYAKRIVKGKSVNPPENNSIYKQTGVILAAHYSHLVRFWSELETDRNNLNHAGWGDDYKKGVNKDFHSRLEMQYPQLIEELRRFWNEAMIQKKYDNINRLKSI